MQGSQSGGSGNDAAIPLLAGSHLGPDQHEGVLLDLMSVLPCQCSMSTDATGDVDGRVNDVGIDAPATGAAGPTTQTANLAVDGGLDTSGTVSVSGEQLFSAQGMAPLIADAPFFPDLERQLAELEKEEARIAAGLQRVHSFKQELVDAGAKSTSVSLFPPSD
jgi:hypothetical protein